MIAEGVPAAQIGLVSMAAGLGGILGAMLAPSLIHRMPTGRLTVLIGWMCCLPLVPLTVSSSVWTACASTFFLLLLNPVGNAGISSYRMAVTPAHLQGRVGSTSQFASMSVMPLGTAARRLPARAPGRRHGDHRAGRGVRAAGRPAHLEPVDPVGAASLGVGRRSRTRAGTRG